MRVILVSVGTDGDVLPYVGLGTRLRSRGHTVILAASAHYESLARAHRLDFRELVTAQEHDALFGHPDFWNPLKTARLSARWGVRLVRRQYDLLSGLISDDAVLVSNPGVFAAPMVHEKFGTPLTTLLLQPGLIPSSMAPPVMPGLAFLRRAPRPVWRVFWRSLDAVGHVLAGRFLNRMRHSLGLRPLRRIFREWFSPQLVIGLFPPWYGPPQADWPPQIRLTNFPSFDGDLGGEANDGLAAPLAEFCRADRPPVAFTFGTGMAHPAALFRAALEACAVLRVRGIFLTKYGSQLPPSLPPSVFHSGFAPFRKLFPRCAAVVHHGGIGTTARAMEAGVPQLICPLCFDQEDNAARVKALEVGDGLRSRRLDGTLIARALARLMTPETQARCREISAQIKGTDGLEPAADWVEATQHGRSHASTHFPPSPPVSSPQSHV